MPRPRGRSRLARPRLSRMDAAVDAMVQFGFPEQKVKKHVTELLKVYGGDDSWPFIEEFSYKVLLESMLEEGDDQEQATQSGNLLEDKSCGNEEAGCSSSRACDTEKDIIPPDTIESSSGVVGETTLVLPASSPSRDSIPLVVATHCHKRRRVPCYGWIDSDEDDDADHEFIDLRPMEVQVRATLDVTTWRKKRRSRWDVKPGDP